MTPRAACVYRAVSLSCCTGHRRDLERGDKRKRKKREDEPRAPWGATGERRGASSCGQPWGRPGGRRAGAHERQNEQTWRTSGWLGKRKKEKRRADKPNERATGFKAAPTPSQRLPLTRIPREPYRSRAQILSHRILALYTRYSTSFPLLSSFRYRRARLQSPRCSSVRCLRWQIRQREGAECPLRGKVRDPSYGLALMYSGHLDMYKSRIERDRGQNRESREDVEAGTTQSAKRSSLKQEQKKIQTRLRRPPDEQKEATTMADHPAPPPPNRHLPANATC